MSRAKRVDANQSEIVDALRAVGARVQVTSAVGEGFPDLFVVYRATIHALEVKDGAKPPSDRKLTPAQVEWHRQFSNPNLHVVCTVDEALAAIGAKR